jgi:hypothetical protein
MNIVCLHARLVPTALRGRYLNHIVAALANVSDTERGTRGSARGACGSACRCEMIASTRSAPPLFEAIGA